ncbi:MAG: MFS transporter [Anaerolineales bacterium]|nr:MFS transporter [Anaerolineales bacterium]
MGTFFVIWGGQLVSIIGSGLTSFALGVYVYQITGSATSLGLVLLANSLPRLLFAPVAGALVDRWDRRWMMILSDTGAGLSTLVIWLLLATGKLQVWHIYLTAAASSFFGIFQEPAYRAATTLLVPKEHYGRAAGLVQLGSAIGQIISPILAGFLVVAIQIQGVILIDFATYIFAALTLAFIRIPRPEITAEGEAGRGSLLREAGYGWTYLKERSGLLGLLILFAFVNFSLGFFSALFTPLILSFSTADVLGSILSVSGIGMVIGSIVMSAWGGAKRKVNSLMGAIFLAGLAFSLVGVRAYPWLIGVAIFSFFMLVPIASGSSQAIWQVKVAPDVQGRVFATRSMIATMATPLAYILAGPLADKVFEPLMAADGALAKSVGAIIGVGPGRGIGLIFIIMGLLVTLATVVGYSHPRIRLVEDELPDFIADGPLAEAEATATAG